MAFLIHFSVRFAGLFLFWFLLSGKADAFHLLTGAATASVISAFSLRGGAAPNTGPLRLVTLIYRSACYGLWLLSRILLAAWHVTKLVWTRRMRLDPKFIKHHTSLTSETARVLFANSITLTPGTITAEIEGNELLVHQLDGDSSGDITSGLMESHIARIFTRKSK